MSKPANINSLSALRQRKATLKAEEEAARHGLSSSLAKTPAKAKDYALEDLALPALGVGLAVYVGYRILRSKPAPPQPVNDNASVNSTPATGAPMSSPTSPPPPSSVPAYRSPSPTAQQSVGGSSIDFNKIASFAKLAVPVAQAIIGVVQNHKSNQELKTTVPQEPAE